MTTLKRRVWIKSGVVEELDIKQQRLVDLVFEKIQHYYRDLYQTRACFQYPLSLSRLARLCKRSGTAVVGALRVLANTIPEDAPAGAEPRVWYERVPSERHMAKRYYRIFLRGRGI